jgi:hypothetical protein
MNHLTPAQAAQQHNRDGSGQYQTKQNAEADPLAPKAIDLEEGETHEIEADGEVFQRVEVTRQGDEYIATATPDPVDMAYLLDARTPDGSLVDQFDTVIGQSRVHAIQRFIGNRYKNVQFVDSGAEDHELPIEVYTSYSNAPTEEKVYEDLWETGATLANESDPGTFGSEYLGRLLSEHLDKQVFTQPYPFQFGDGTWAGEAPPSSLEVVREFRRLMNDPTQVVSDRTAMARAHALGYRNEGLAEFAEKGYLDRESLIAAANSVGADDLAAWARAQKTTSELLHPDE